MAVAYPPRAVGEPCPTAMLGEGAHLLNSKGERFFKSKTARRSWFAKNIIK